MIGNKKTVSPFPSLFTLVGSGCINTPTRGVRYRYICSLTTLRDIKNAYVNGEPAHLPRMKSITNVSSKYETAKEIRENLLLLVQYVFVKLTL